MWPKFGYCSYLHNFRLITLNCIILVWSHVLTSDVHLKMHIWLEVSTAGGTLGPRRSTRQNFFRLDWKLLPWRQHWTCQRGKRVWSWQHRRSWNKFLTFAICRGFSEELTLVFNERCSTVTLFQMLNNPDFVQNCVFPAKLALVIGDPDQLSAGFPVKLVVK